MGKAIGIDFGTTNTVVTYLDKKNRFRQLRLNQRDLIPSVLHFNTLDEYEIGIPAQNKNKQNPSAGVRSFKSMLGDPSARHEVCPSEGGERKRVLLPRVAVELFLNKVIQSVEEQLIKEFGATEGVLDKMVLTVPAKFNAVERTAIRKAAMKALSTTDKNAVRLTYEPTAAAIAALDEEDTEEDTLMVYDFGGGTFDVSIIKRQDGVYRQIDSDGDKRLGGNALTGKLLNKILESINEDYGLELPLDEAEFDEDYHNLTLAEYRGNIYNLFNDANRAKEELSDEMEIDISLNVTVEKGKHVYLNWRLERSDLEKLLYDDLKRTVDISRDLLERNRDRMRVQKLVLAGGSSRIPMIREMLEEAFPDMEITSNMNVSTLISRGAAILAQRLEEMDRLTAQKTSMRIGVSASEGVQFNKFFPIIMEGQDLPCEGSREFFLNMDDQPMLEIQYYEHDVSKNPEATFISDEGIEAVDTVRIKLPGGLKKDNTKLKLTFRMEKDGSQIVSAQVRDLNDRLLYGADKLELSMKSDLI